MFGEEVKFRKKPVMVEATQWFKNGDHPHDDRPAYKDPIFPGKWTLGEGKVVRYFRHPGVAGDRQCEHCTFYMKQHGWIDTLEGGHNVCPGDWVITGVKGERYPCKPDIFIETYEVVNE